MNNIRDKRKWSLFSTFISGFRKVTSQSCMYCAKGNFLHVQYALYLHALDARRAMKCGMVSVTWCHWCDVTANHRRAAHSIPHFTFLIPHAAVPHFTHSRTRPLLLLAHKTPSPFFYTYPHKKPLFYTDKWLCCRQLKKRISAVVQ